MTSYNVTVVPSGLTDPGLHTALLVTSSIALIGCTICLITKLVLGFVIPIAWKCCLICQDVAFMAFSLGLLLVSCYTGGASHASCTAGGYFLLFGVLDLASSITFMGITLILIQNPSKMSHLSKFRWGGFLTMVVLQKVVICILAALPVLPLEDFDQSTPYPLMCFPVRQEGAKGDTFGAILFFIIWVILATAFILCVVVAVKFWAGPGTRVHASSPSLWQMQKMEQGRTWHKFILIELGVALLLIVVLTALVYGNKTQASAPQWAGLLAFAVLVIVHVILAVVQLTMWSSLCCDRTGHKKEPHHRLKQLELIKTEGPGRVRLKASWAAGKGVWKQGLLKVYGPEHIKAWAQEIVVLGLLRKSHSASVLQCLWTSNSNPYYETMTLISGNIVASDSRLTCLELTSSGTLQEYLKKMDTPLPDQCQRTIMHDIAEGLSYLHAQNVLHRNLTSATVYLKGSIQYAALRAAVGDFEDAQIYGTFLTGSTNSTISRKRFLYPDIRAYALVGIEMLARVCECQQLLKQPKFPNSNQTWAHQPRHKVFHRPYHDNVVPGIQKSTVRNNEVHQSKAIGRRLQVNEMQVSSKQDAKDYFPQPTSGILGKDSKKSNMLTSVTELEESSKDYNIDQNWKLQVRSADMVLSSNWREQAKSNTSFELEDGRQNNVPEAARIFLVKEASENSAFHHQSSMSEGINTIEEEVFETGQRYQRKNGQLQQAGYVTSKTEDGREVFVPAITKAKKSSAASSSGYGSGGGSTPVLFENNTVSENAANAGVKQVYRPVSAGQTADTDGIDVLPGMTDRSRRGDEILDELFKAKKDAEVEQLLESYDERVRRELGTNNIEMPHGVVFPKANTKTMPDIPGSLNYNEDAHLQNKGLKVMTARPSTAFSSAAQRLQRSAERPTSAENMASTAWNPRSSIKRTKARTALKKALTNKEVVAIPQLQTVAQVRGAKAKDIEMKYTKMPLEDRTLNAGGGIFQTQMGTIIQNTGAPEVSTKPTQMAQKRKPVSKVRSTKSRPAPQPPTAQTPQAQPTPMAQSSQMQQPPAVVQTQQSLKAHPENAMATPVGVDRMSSFNNYDESAKLSGKSSFMADAGSTDSESSSRTNQYTREQISVEKIESDMNEIINSSTDPTFMSLPPGVKLIDSGFDSASVSSEESCLCAASALQTVEDGSCSGPSEIFSQGTTCSCACSNCLGSSQRNKNSSSWTGSQDSESWSNSNSFSSYDVNMHRRKLPRSKGKDESPGCILAPDEQYPSPGHRSNYMQRRGSYKLKRNHRHLVHTREHYTSSSSEASSAASRRYRELLKKGIAFKVSVIPGDSRGELHKGANSLLSPLAEQFNNEAVVSAADDISDLENESDEEMDQIHKLSPIPSLDDIIKEIPDETGKYSEESRAFINRPDSELSLKALQEVLSGHCSASEMKIKIPKELMIERIFNHQGPPINMPSNFGLRGTQDVDDSVIREVAMLPGREEAEDTKDVVGLLSGMDGRHIRFCHGISSRVSMVRMSDLLPANNQTFDKLAMRLRISGDISSAGHQILDLMRMCWLNEAPPTTTVILSQLTDPITETEL